MYEFQYEVLLLVQHRLYKLRYIYLANIDIVMNGALHTSEQQINTWSIIVPSQPSLERKRQIDMYTHTPMTLTQTTVGLGKSGHLGVTV